MDASDIAAIRCAALNLLYSWRALILSAKCIHCLYDIYLHCRDDFVTGDPNFNQEIDTMRSKAEQQGTAQPELRDAAKEIKKVLFPQESGMLWDSGLRTQREGVYITSMYFRPCLRAQFLTSIVPLRRTLQASTQRQRQTVPLEVGTERHVSGPES